MGRSQSGASDRSARANSFWVPDCIQTSVANRFGRRSKSRGCSRISSSLAESLTQAANSQPATGKHPAPSAGENSMKELVSQTVDSTNASKAEADKLLRETQ